MTSKASIEKLADELYRAILIAYEANPDLTFSEILQTHLAKFNDDVAAMVNKEIGTIINSSVGAISGIVRPMETLALSSLLYKNSDYVAKQVMGVINEHLLLRSTIDEIRKALYDGYDVEDVIGIGKKVKLPKYLLESLTEAKILKLKTKSLAAGYFGILDAKTDKAMEKALYVAAQEKARWYALRIATVEESKAFNLMVAGEHLAEGVEYVKFTLSGRHKTACICDFYATQNIGFGSGIYPIRQAPMPTYSTHPFCQCQLRKVDNPRRWTPSINPTESALEKFTKDERINVERGLRSKWGTVLVGDVF